MLAGSGPLSVALAGLTAPFDVIDRYVGARARPTPAPRSRLELIAGSGAWFDGGRRAEVGGGFALEVASIPGAGAAGTGHHTIGLGQHSRLEGAQVFDAGSGDLGRTGARFVSRTTLLGRAGRELVDTPDGLRGGEWLLALGTGFTYDTRRLAAEKDRITIAHLVGGQAMVVTHHGPLTSRFDGGLYLDFGMVQALVFGPAAPFPEMPLTSALKERGYYFGGGVTSETHLGLAYRWLRLDGSLRAHGLFAIDGLDRREIGGPEDPHGVNDQRVIGRLRLGVELGPGPFSLGAVAERVVRRGAWSARSRTVDDATLGVELSVVPAL